MHIPLISESFSPIHDSPDPSSSETGLAEDASQRRDISTRFGARLRSLRQQRNMTQLRMATEFGIDRSFISDVERGKKSISLPMLEVIALGMKITLSELLQDI
jgi:ribosome-binding protein aMBF1 (putative translation factor)